MVDIAQQIILELLLLMPLVQRLHGIGADAQHHRPLGINLWEGIAEGAGLHSAARRAGFGEGEQNHSLAAQVLEPDERPILVGKGKTGRFIANGYHVHSILVHLKTITKHPPI